MSELKKKDLSIAEENKENFKESVIERKNLTNRFTIADIEKHLNTLYKMKREIDGTVRVAEKMVENIEENHGELIKKITEEERSHLWLLQQNLNIIGDGKPQQKEIDEEVAKHEGYLDTIYDAFGFVKSAEVTEVELNDNETTPDSESGTKEG